MTRPLKHRLLLVRRRSGTCVVVGATMSVSFAINSIAINEDQTINLSPGGVLVIVGPNNGGKSAMLRGIKSRLYGNGHGGTEVVSAVKLSGTGDETSLRQWVEENLIRKDDRGETTYSWYSQPFTMGADPIFKWQQQFQNQ